jgi:hypothetical protein
MSEGLPHQRINQVSTKQGAQAYVGTFINCQIGTAEEFQSTSAALLFTSINLHACN